MARLKRIWRESQHPRDGRGRFSRRGGAAWIKRAAVELTSAPGSGDTRSASGRPQISRSAKAGVVLQAHADGGRPSVVRVPTATRTVVPSPKTLADFNAKGLPTPVKRAAPQPTNLAAFNAPDPPKKRTPRPAAGAAALIAARTDEQAPHTPAMVAARTAPETAPVQGAEAYAAMRRHTLLALARDAGVSIRGKSNTQIANELAAHDAKVKADRAAKLNPTGVGAGLSSDVIVYTTEGAQPATLIGEPTGASGDQLKRVRFADGTEKTLSPRVVVSAADAQNAWHVVDERGMVVAGGPNISRARAEEIAADPRRPGVRAVQGIPTEVDTRRVNPNNGGMTPTKAQEPYTVGKRVEIEITDFETPGFPKKWVPGTVSDAEVDEDSGLLNVRVRLDSPTKTGGEYAGRQLVGKRGGNKQLRPLGEGTTPTTSTPGPYGAPGDPIPSRGSQAWNRAVGAMQIVGPGGGPDRPMTPYVNRAPEVGDTVTAGGLNRKGTVVRAIRRNRTDGFDIQWEGEPYTRHQPGSSLGVVDVPEVIRRGRGEGAPKVEAPRTPTTNRKQIPRDTKVRAIENQRDGGRGVVARHRDLTRAEFDAMSENERTRVLQDLRQVAQSGEEESYTIPSSRSSMGMTVRGRREAAHVTAAKAKIRDLTYTAPPPVDNSAAGRAARLKAGDRFALEGATINDLSEIAHAAGIGGYSMSWKRQKLVDYLRDRATAGDRLPLKERGGEALADALRGATPAQALAVLDALEASDGVTIADMKVAAKALGGKLPAGDKRRTMHALAALGKDAPPKAASRTIDPLTPQQLSGRVREARARLAELHGFDPRRDEAKAKVQEYERRLSLYGWVVPEDVAPKADAAQVAAPARARITPDAKRGALARVDTPRVSSHNDGMTNATNTPKPKSKLAHNQDSLLRAVIAIHDELGPAPEWPADLPRNRVLTDAENERLKPYREAYMAWERRAREIAQSFGSPYGWSSSGDAGAKLRDKGLIKWNDSHPLPTPTAEARQVIASTSPTPPPVKKAAATGVVAPTLDRARTGTYTGDIAANRDERLQDKAFTDHVTSLTLTAHDEDAANAFGFDNNDEPLQVGDEVMVVTFGRWRRGLVTGTTRGGANGGTTRVAYNTPTGEGGVMETTNRTTGIMRLVDPSRRPAPNRAALLPKIAPEARPRRMSEEDKAAAKEARKEAEKVAAAKRRQAFFDEKIKRITEALNGEPHSNTPEWHLQMTTEEGLMSLAKHLGVKVPNREKNSMGHPKPRDLNALRASIVDAVRARRDAEGKA